MKKYSLSVTLALAILAGCGSHDEPATGKESPVSFSASIKGATTSRAYDQSWEPGDKIGISGTTGEKAYTNVAYSTDGTSSFTIVSPGSEIYYQSPDPVTFTAYYPHTADHASITADTHDQTSQKDFDYLWAQAEGKKDSPGVSFAFDHKMAKLVLTVKKGSDVNFDEIKKATYTLAGFKNKGSFDPASGIAIATGDASGAWTFSTVAPASHDEAVETAIYTFIIFPQEFSAPLPLTATTTRQTFSTALDFTAANTAAGDNGAKNEWVAGRQYNISVTLLKTAFIVNDCTITAWNEADGGNFDAE